MFNWRKGATQMGSSSSSDNSSMLANELNSADSCRLLRVVDEMREILHQEKIALPHIVVVGDQSVSILYKYYIFHLYLPRLVNHQF